MTNCLTSGKLSLDSLVSKAYIKEFKQLTMNDKMSRLSKAFTRHQYVVVVEESKHYIVESDHLLNSFLNASK